jgi:signal transduction histidine kinase
MIRHVANTIALRHRCAALFLALALAAAMVPGLAQARQNVLFIFDEEQDLPGLALINRGLREVFQREMKDGVELYSEALHVSQFKDPGYYGVLREYFRRKYDGKRPDLIVAVMGPSLDFLLREGKALFPGVPIVICGADPSDVEGKALPGNVTGVLVKRTFAPTLDIALRLQPDTRNVFVVGGAARFDRQIQAIARRDLQPFEGKVAINWLTALPFNELLTRLANLPAHSVVYYLTLFADGSGSAFVPHEALSRIAAVASAPVYVSLDQFVGLGAVGGHVYSVTTHGEQAAEIGVRILRGAAPASIPLVAVAADLNLFDWRQLHRWGLEERALPAGSVVEFRNPSVWDLYRWYIVGGVVLFLLQSALVVGLLANRAELRRAETAREESEQRRRRAEEEAQRQRDELAHALRVTTLGELTASFAHELNQPLTAIAANAQAARRLLIAGRLDPDVREAIDDLAADAVRAGETVRRLQALFRKQPAGRAPLDVNALIDDVLHLLATDIRRRNIAVHFARGERLPAVLGDGVQLRQVLINLLVNAAEAIAAAGEGPREIRIETRRRDAGHVAVAIRDSGLGAKESDLERMFEHFVTTKPHGLGMGLAISRSIVEAHGGRIWADRNEERGITLHIHLPVPPRQDDSSGGDRGAVEAGSPPRPLA